MRGVLEPGERLRDGSIAESLGVSRTPVREALRRLEDEGLVESSASRWTKVSGLDLAEAVRLYPIVWALEPLALRFAARLEAAGIERMEAANERLRRAVDESDRVAASEADMDFHKVFTDASDNAELIKMLGDLKTKLFRLEVVYFGGQELAERSIAEHERILDALRDEDYAAAARNVESNWKQSLKRLLDQEDLRLEDFEDGALADL